MSGRVLKIEKRPASSDGTGLFVSYRLSTETKLLDDASVSLDVNFLEVVQQLTPFTYETEKSTTGNHVFLVLLHMLCEVIDTVGK